jgi:hypothetical protein
VDPRRLSWHEIAAIVGGGLLALGVFLPWYHADNRRVEISGTTGPGDFSPWEVHPILRWLLLATAIAPLVLTWIVFRGHKLSWPRGEMTAVVAIAALGLAVYNGIIDRPGEPKGLVSVMWGFFVAFAGLMLMVVGSALRASMSERPRKPPGVL